MTKPLLQMTCSACGKHYIRRDRKPQPGQHNFCPRCQAEGIPNRIRVRESRNRKGN